MVQIDYKITIFYKAFFIKKFLSEALPLNPRQGGLKHQPPPPLDLPAAIVRGQAPPHPPVGVWGPNPTEARPMKEGR